MIILSAHTSGMANAVTSLSGFDTILNNNESSYIYFSASSLTFLLQFYCWATYFELGTNVPEHKLISQCVDAGQLNIPL